jgi:hypothetical protein
MGSYAAQYGGFGMAEFTAAQIKGLALLPVQAISGSTTINQWRGMIAIAGNDANFFTDDTDIDAASSARLLTKTPASSGVSGISVAPSAAGLSAASVNAVPMNAATATAACTATMAIRFVVNG